MNARPHWCEADQAARELSRRGGDYRSLYLLARLPLLSEKAIERLSGLCGGASVYRSLNWLAHRGLIAHVRASLCQGLGPRLFYLTDLGVATVALYQDEDPNELARRARLRRTDLLAAVAGLPQLMAAYDLLGALALSLPSPPDQVVWEHPWRRRYQRPTAKDPVGVAFPARVELAWEGGAAEFLLLPDLGGVPLRAHRARLDHLLVLRNLQPQDVPVLVLATTTVERRSAWQDLLQETARWRGEAPLAVCLTLWDDIEKGLGPAPYVATPAPPPLLDPTKVAQASPAQSELPASRVPKLIGSEPLTSTTRRAVERLGKAALRLTPSDRWLLDLVARHPFLTPQELAELAGWTVKALRARRDRLIAGGLVRLLARAEISKEVKPNEFAEATLIGLRVVAAQQGLRLAEAVRYNGLAGGGPERPVGTRPALVTRLPHTLGVNWFFLDLVQTGRRFTDAGYDDALVEWWNEKQCSRGPFRPDGYGIYRHCGQPYAFFLEYDRGRMPTRDFNEKFDAYFNYQAAGAAHQEYQGFPTVLIVTPDYGSEARILRGLRAASCGRTTKLPVLITTWKKIEEDPDRLLGPIWREPASPMRRCWPLDPLPSPTVRRASPIGSRDMTMLSK